MTDLPPDIAAALDACPAAQRAALEQLRALIFQTAAALPEVGPLTETLKWGEPAYLTEATRTGSTLRIGPVQGRPDRVALFVNCQTVLADRFRQRFGPALEVQGDRAVLIDVAAPLDREVLGACIAMVLTYHRWKAAA